MANIKVETSELDKMIANLTKVKNVFPSGTGGLSPALKQAFDKVGDAILQDTKKETPVGDDTRPNFHEGSKFHPDKKHLRDSWKWKLKVNGSIVEGYTYVQHAKLNDLIDLLGAGSPRHSIEAKPGSVLRFYVRGGGGWQLAYAKKVIDHPGFKANNFIERAQDKADIHVQKLVSVMQKEINRVLTAR